MKAAALVPNRMFTAVPLRQWVDARCGEAGIEVEWVNISESTDRFHQCFNDHQNLIAWNCRMPPEWLARSNRNILHVDNSLISQKAGVFIDNGGLFALSNFCRNKAWEGSQQANAEFFARRDFGWQAWSGGTPDGPVLVALQCRNDSAVVQGFQWPAGTDPVSRVLSIVAAHLPRGRRVWVRPHPIELKKYAASSFVEGPWRDDFELQTGSSFAEVLPQCSAMVTINSTCAHEAVLLGLPTATLGTGTFTGSKVTLECAQDSSRLGVLFSHTPDNQVARGYVNAALTSHFLPYDIRPDRRSAEFDLWLAKAKIERDSMR